MQISEIICEDIPKPSGGGIHRTLQHRPDTKIGREAMHGYSYGSVSKSIGDYLHKKYRGKDVKTIPTYLKNIDKEFTKLPPLKKEIKVYTGIPQSPSRVWELNNANPAKPVRAHLPAFTSTTTNFNIAKEFSAADTVNLKKFTPHKVVGTIPQKFNFNEAYILQLMYIIVPAGYTAVSMKNISGYSRESEILLPRGLDILINPHPILVINKGQVICIWGAKVVGSNPIQIIS